MDIHTDGLTDISNYRVALLLKNSPGLFSWTLFYHKITYHSSILLERLVIMFLSVYLFQLWMLNFSYLFIQICFSRFKCLFMNVWILYLISKGLFISYLSSYFITTYKPLIKSRNMYFSNYLQFSIICIYFSLIMIR